MLPDSSTELSLLEDADARARRWLAGVGGRPVFPGPEAIAAVQGLDEPLTSRGYPENETLTALDDIGGAAVVGSNGPRYHGFVVGSTLPIAAAADRLVSVWDQCASSHLNSPTAHALEKQAGRWVLEALGLPEGSAVGFTTSATAGTISAIATARRSLLAAHGWDTDTKGVRDAPPVRVVVSDLAHVTVLKALRVLGFGLDDVLRVPTEEGRMRAAALPVLDDLTILVLQAGEVNTGEFDPFSEIIPVAKKAGAWVHIDGAFGLWVRASRRHAYLAHDVEFADSWTTDAHKWLNTPYDGAMLIVRDARLLAQTLNADSVYAMAEADAQKNLTLEFSRRARGVPVWAALRTLGYEGVEALVDNTIALAGRLADGLASNGYTILNHVRLNQVLVRAGAPDLTRAVLDAAQSGGATWFGSSAWQGEPVLRLSISSWRTTQAHIDELVVLLAGYLRDATNDVQ